MKNFKILFSIFLLTVPFSLLAQWSFNGVNNINNTFTSTEMFAQPIFGTVTNHPLQIRTNNLTRINIHQNGNVGIGTTNSQRRMQIHGTGPILGEPAIPGGNNIPPLPPPGTESCLVMTNAETGSTAHDGLRIGLFGSRAEMRLNENMPLVFTTGESFISMRPDGRIGFFSNSVLPNSRVSILAANANGLTITNSSNPNGYAFMVETNSTTTEAISVRQSNSTRFVVKGDGRVGIGTETPSTDYLLDVAGKTRACEVRVNNPGWCDYVFEPTYQLMPLNDLKLYLSVNKHLPEMPSEKEVVAAGGFDLAQMNVALLKRSEENTLYILELEEKIQKLTDALNAQAQILEMLTSKQN